jgi:hypothetical protein
VERRDLVATPPTLLLDVLEGPVSAGVTPNLMQYFTWDLSSFRAPRFGGNFSDITAWRVRMITVCRRSPLLMHGMARNVSPLNRCSCPCFASIAHHLIYTYVYIFVFCEQTKFLSTIMFISTLVTPRKETLHENLVVAKLLKKFLDIF